MSFTKESYELIRQEAEARGIDYWQLLAEAVSEYLDKPIDYLTAEQKEQEKVKRWALVEKQAMDSLISGPKHITHIMKNIDPPVSRMTLQSRLDFLASQGLLKKAAKGKAYGKTVYEWSLTAKPKKKSLERTVWEFIEKRGHKGRTILHDKSALVELTGKTPKEIRKALRESEYFMVDSVGGVTHIIQVKRANSEGPAI